MRVLVTGHDGYIGDGWCRCCLAAGHDVVGLDSGLFASCAFGANAGDGARRSTWTSATSPPTTSRASTRSSTSPASRTTRSATSTPTARTTSTTAARCGWPSAAKAAGVARFLFSSSCSLYGAAGDDFLDENADVQPGDALRRVEGAAPSATCRALADDDLQPDLPAQRHRLRRLAPPARRPRGQQPRRATRSRPARCSSRATARRGARSSTSRTSRAPSSRCSRRRATLVHNEAFNVGRTDGELPDPRGRRASSSEVVPGSTVDVRRATPSPDTRNYRVNCDKLCSRAAGLPAAVDGAHGRRGARTTPTSRVGLTLDDLDRRAAASASRRVRELLDEDRLDHDLRWTATVAGATRRTWLTSAPPCRSCGTARSADVPRPGRDAAGGRPRRQPELSDRDEPPLPARRRVLPGLLARADPREVPPEQLFVDNYLYFSSFSDSLLRALARARGRPDRDARPRRRQPRRRARQQRRLPAAQLRRARRSGARHRPGARPRRRPREAGVPTLAEFFGVELAERLRAEGRRADVIIANNVMAHVPDLNGFVAGMAALLDDDGVITDREPVRARPDRPLRVRHDLPRALLLLLVHRGRRPWSRRHGCTSTTSSTSPTSTAARCAGGSASARTAARSATRVPRTRRARTG